MSDLKHHTLYRTTNIPEWYKNNPIIDTGTLNRIYLGIVKDTQDPQKMGRIMVWIPELTGDGNKPENWSMCSYCSPFAGASFFDIGIHQDKEGSSALRNLKEIAKDRTPELKDNIQSGRQSYGMWFVPPDIGNEVLVAFINGDPNRGVWIGCLYQQDTNHMVPGIAQDIISSGNSTNEIGPVIEHDARDGFPSNPKRKLYKPLYESLKFRQGLDKDGARGQSISSAQREAPSEVFGILTPDGNSFVMDDGVVDTKKQGDDRREEELIRLRTKSGVQLLLHQSKGFIYMITKDGKTWIELSNDGDIDIYGTSNISVHAERGNINLKAGSATSDINIQAGRDINIRAGRDLRIVSERDTHVNVNENMKTTVGFIPLRPGISGGTYDLHVKNAIKIETDDLISQKAGQSFALNAGSNFGITADGNLNEQAANIFMNSGPGPQAIPTTNATFPPTFSVTGPSIQKNSTTAWEEGKPYIDGTNIIPRVPQHEPWKEHSIELRGISRNVIEGPLTDAKLGATSSTADAPLPINTPEKKRKEDGFYNSANQPEFQTIKDLPNECLLPISQLQISDVGITLIKQFEGNELTVYQDIAGLDTIGIGHLITNEEKQNGRFSNGVITEEESRQLLLEDLSNLQKSIRNCIQQPLTQEQYDALISLAFNIGATAFCNSTLVKKINANEYIEVPNQMMRWTKARIGGSLTTVKGLITRREIEAQLFSSFPSCSQQI